MEKDIATSTRDQHRTTAHLIETIGHHLGHTARHSMALKQSKTAADRTFNQGHMDTHLNGAMEHVQKLYNHMHDNYPSISRELDAINAVQPKSMDSDFEKFTPPSPQVEETAALRQAKRGSAGRIRYDAAPGKNPKLHQPIPNRPVPAPENYN